MELAIILFAGAAILFVWLYLWSLQREKSARVPEVAELLANVPTVAGDAVLVAREHGEIVYADDTIRRWLSLDGKTPDLETIAARTQPADNFLDLFAGKTRTAFQLERRWVEASARQIPAGAETRTVVLMREVNASPTSPDSFDVSAAIAIAGEISATINAGLSVEQVLQALITIVHKAIPADAGEICLWDETEQRLTPRGWVGDMAYVLALAETGGAYALDEGISGWIARYRKPALVADVSDPAALRPKLDAGGYRSFVGVPLLMGERFIGTFELASKQGGRFSAAELALLQAVAPQMTTSIYNAQLYAEQSRRIEDLAGLQDMSYVSGDPESTYAALTERIARLLGAEICGILLYNELRGALVAQPPFYGLPVHAVRSYAIPVPEGSPQHDIWRLQPSWMSNDLVDEPIAGSSGMSLLINAAGVYNTLLMPLEVGVRRIGMIQVANKPSHGGFTPQDVQHLRLLAAQAAVIVEEIRLAGQIESQTAELSGLREITQAFGESGDEEALFATLTRRIARLLDVEMCGFLTYDSNSRRLIAQPPFYGLDDATAAGYAIALEPESAAERVWLNEDYWYSNHVSTDALAVSAGLADFASANAVKGILFAVLSTGERRIGVVQVANRRGGEFSDHDARLLVIFAGQIAGMLDTTRRFREAQRQSEEVERLYGTIEQHYNERLLELDALSREEQARSERLQRRVEQLSQVFELGQMVQTNVDAAMMLEAIAYSVQQSCHFNVVMMALLDKASGEIRRVAQAGLPPEAFDAAKTRKIALTQFEKLYQKDEFRISESYFLPREKSPAWYVAGLETFSASSAAADEPPALEAHEWHEGDMLLVPIHGPFGSLMGVMSVDRPADGMRPDLNTVEILEIFAHQTATMIENTRLYATTTRSAEQEAQLNQVMEAIASTLDMGEIVEAVARGSLRLLPFMRLTMALLDTDGQGFDVLHATVKSDSSLTTGHERRSNLSHTALGLAFETGQDQLYQADDPAMQSFDDLRSWAAQGERTALVVPLITGGVCLGAMHIGSDLIRAFGFEEYRPLLQRIANLAAVAVQNARLFSQAVNLRLFNESVVQSIQQGIIVLDSSGRVITVNDYTRRRFGWDGDVQRRDLFEYRPSLRFLADTLRAVVEGGEPQSMLNQSIDEDGEARVQNFYFYPLRSADAVRGAVLLIDDVTERARLEEELAARTRRLSLLNRISVALAQSLDTENVLDVAMRELGQVFDIERAKAYLIDRDAHGARLIVERPRGDLPPTDVIDIQRSAVFQTILGSVKALVIEDVAAWQGDEAIRAEISGRGLSAYFALPMIVGGQVSGVFEFEVSGAPHYIEDERIELALIVANQAAIAVLNASLLEQTLVRTRELETLLEAAQATSYTLDLDEVFASVVRLILQALEMDDCALMMYDDIEEALRVELTMNRMGDDSHLVPSGTVYDLRQYPARMSAVHEGHIAVIRHDDPNGDAKELAEMRETGGRARMLVPLVVHDQAIGLLQVDLRAEYRALTHREVRMAQALAAQAATSIENARLSTETAAQVEQSLVINELSRAISSTMDIDTIIRIVREQVPNLTTAEEIYMALYNADTDEITFPMAVRAGQDIAIPPRAMGSDEVSFIIRHRRPLPLGGENPDANEVRRNLGIANGEEDAQRYLGVPLIAGDQVIGVLAVRDREQKRPFGLNDQRILTTIGAQIGATIQNARLFARVQNFAAELNQRVEERTLELQEEAEKNSAIVAGIADGVLLADANGVVILFNNAAEAILGLASADVIGKPLAHLSDVEGAAAWTRALDNWATNPHNPDDEMTLDRLDLGRRIVSIHAAPVYVGDQLLGTVAVFRDVTKDVEVDRMKSEFISNVSHELRTPMTSIMGYVDLLMKGAVGEISEQQRQFLGTIKNNASRLTTLVNDLLDISRLDTGRDQVRTTDVDVKAVVDGVVASLRGRSEYEGKAMTIAAAVEPDVPLIRADRDKVTQILTNIADNAFNYTYAGGKIDIGAKLHPDKPHVLLTVQDNGIGIPEEFQSRIWTRFERHEEHALVMDVAGTGLGLSIVKTLVEMHGGDIWFKSEVNRGTTFYISLPISLPNEAARDANRHTVEG